MIEFTVEPTGQDVLGQAVDVDLHDLAWIETIVGRRNIDVAKLSIHASKDVKGYSAFPLNYPAWGVLVFRSLHEGDICEEFRFHQYFLHLNRPAYGVLLIRGLDSLRFLLNRTSTAFFFSAPTLRISRRPDL